MTSSRSGVAVLVHDEREVLAAEAQALQQPVNQHRLGDALDGAHEFA